MHSMIALFSVDIRATVQGTCKVVKLYTINLHAFESVLCLRNRRLVVFCHIFMHSWIALSEVDICTTVRNGGKFEMG